MAAGQLEQMASHGGRARERHLAGPLVAEQHNLTSDQAGVADNQDPNLVNAWGLAAGPTSPWWVADNGTDLSTLYNAAGVPRSLVVSVKSAPTGTVFNGTAGAFPVGTAGSLFIFATEEGTILGWNGGTSATVEVPASGGAVFKGLAIATTPAGPRIFATDFHNGAVDVFDASWKPVANAGFDDPFLPPPLRSVRDPDDRRPHLRDLREAAGGQR